MWMFVCAAHVTRDRDNLVEVSDGYTIFRPPCSCTTKIHYHGDLSSVNLCKNISKNIWSLEKRTDLKLGEVFSFSSAWWSGYFLWCSGRGEVSNWPLLPTGTICWYLPMWVWEFSIFNILYFTKHENVSRKKRFITNGSASSLGMATYAAVWPSILGRKPTMVLSFNYC